jgi:hypothetical protein
MVLKRVEINIMRACLDLLAKPRPADKCAADFKAMGLATNRVAISAFSGFLEKYRRMVPGITRLIAFFPVYCLVFFIISCLNNSSEAMDITKYRIDV